MAYKFCSDSNVKQSITLNDTISFYKDSAVIVYTKDSVISGIISNISDTYLSLRHDGSDGSFANIPYKDIIDIKG